ncbi:hypothetical protein [Spirosoma panaciterrae]|uniref:hypothetical protein n=1 Tax=Spirosoma panaciterrae TaxID=496058 RepID=UPI00036CE714|nr:hypothetical protein [Spirosoma panaciterrae]
MTTIEVTVLADEDQDFVINILNALAQKHIIEFDRTNSFPAEGPILTHDELNERILKSEQSKHYSFEEAKAKLGL